MRYKGSPKNKWDDKTLNNLMYKKGRTGHISSKTEKPGMNYCRRPKPTRVCSGGGGGGGGRISSSGSSSPGTLLSIDTSI
jgi:hypothetical protein